jgi:hypothetical protein
MQGLEKQWLRCDQGFDLVVEWDRGAAMILGTGHKVGPNKRPNKVK